MARADQQAQGGQGSSALPAYPPNCLPNCLPACQPVSLSTCAREAGGWRRCAGGGCKERVGDLIGGTEEVLQGNLAHEKQPLRRTLQQAHAQGHVVVPGGGGVLMNEVPLYPCTVAEIGSECWRGDLRRSRPAPNGLVFLGATTCLGFRAQGCSLLACNTPKHLKLSFVVRPGPNGTRLQNLSHTSCL